GLRRPSVDAYGFEIVLANRREGDLAVGHDRDGATVGGVDREGDLTVVGLDRAHIGDVGQAERGKVPGAHLLEFFGADHDRVLSEQATQRGRPCAGQLSALTCSPATATRVPLSLSAVRFSGCAVRAAGRISIVRTRLS